MEATCAATWSRTKQYTKKKTKKLYIIFLFLEDIVGIAAHQINTFTSHHFNVHGHLPSLRYPQTFVISHVRRFGERVNYTPYALTLKMKQARSPFKERCIESIHCGYSSVSDFRACADGELTQLI